MSTDKQLEQLPQNPLVLNGNTVAKFNEIPCYKLYIPYKILSKTSEEPINKCGCTDTLKEKTKIDCFTFYRDVLDYCIG